RRQMQFTYYRGDPLGAKSFPSSGIQALYQDPDGMIWIGSNELLARFNPTDGSFKRYTAFSGPFPLALPESRMVASIVPDEQGMIWFDGIDGLYRFNPTTETFTAYPVPVKLGNPLEVEQIALDGQRRIWVLVQNTLYAFDRTNGQYTANFDIHAAMPAG